MYWMNCIYYFLAENVWAKTKLVRVRIDPYKHRRVALFGGCIGGGAALLGCPGLVLLSPQGQAVWVAPRGAGGRAVDLEYPEMSSDEAAGEWRLALLDVRGVIAPEGREGEGVFSALGCGVRFFLSL